MKSITRIMFLTTALVAMAATLASAEILDLAKNRGGFFGTLNFANQGGDMAEQGDLLAAGLEEIFGGSWTATKGANLGFGVGGLYVIQTSPTFGVEIEGQYIQRGTKLDLQATGVSGLSGVDMTAEFQINYLEIPVLARFSPSPAARVRAVFLVGPVLGFKAGANLKMTLEDQSESESISEGYESVNLGLLGGIGLSAQVGSNTYLVAQARYFLGLTNPIADGEFEAKSGDFGLVVGMEFTPRK